MTKAFKTFLLSMICALSVHAKQARPNQAPDAPTGSVTTAIGFAQVWEAIYMKSDKIEAARLSSEAATIQEDRLRLHWLPRLQAQARTFSTDDPTLHFMNLLGERQVAVADFSPSTLNTPGTKTFTQYSLGVDMPLYEGGQSTAALRAQGHVVSAQSLQHAFARLGLYAEVFEAYGRIILLQEQRSTLRALFDRAQIALEKYRLGTKANPVGYSGLLALRSLKNKVEALLEANSIALLGEKQSLRHQAHGTLSESWSASQTAVTDFIKKFANPTSTKSDSMITESKALMAQAAEERVGAEKARFLPRLGLFAQENIFSGERGTGSGTIAGAYIQWTLGASDLAAPKQARLDAAAAEAQARAFRLQDQVARETSAHALPSLERSLELLTENQGFLDKQWQVSETLFKNGTISAHQLAEILSKHADNTLAQSAAEMQILQVRAKQILQSRMSVSPETIRSLP